MSGVLKTQFDQAEKEYKGMFTYTENNFQILELYFVVLILCF